MKMILKRMQINSYKPSLAIICTLILNISIAYAANNPPIAQLHGKSITENDLIISPIEMNIFNNTCKDINECVSNRKKSLLAAKINGEVFNEYIKKNNISATQDEINDLLQFLHQHTQQNIKRYEHALTMSNSSIDKAQLMETIEALKQSDKDYDSKERQLIAKNMIINWKINRLLYKSYGGKVIFQQMNPAEAVEANCKYLKEQERKKVFTIYDNSYKQAFWKYCDVTTQNSIDISKQVNMDIPWWKSGTAMQQDQ